ncbi:MAG TPA: hypothetical protein VJ922_02065 [Actinomycetota bacterium]|nr:hypothetical protein [Actinomycetota bacterium]
MDDVRTPCAHRGSADVLESNVETPQGPITLCICRTCRRFWLERNGWLLSRRETVSILKTFPFTQAGIERLAR